MANSRQAKKRARQAEKRRQHNASHRSEMRTYVKRVRKAVEAKDSDLAVKEYKAAVSKLDRAAHGGLIHKNKAARLKSRLNSQIKSLTAAA